MSKRIYAELTHDMTRRMRNWAEWSARGGESSVAPSSMWSIVPSGGYREAVIPVLGGEASDIDKALNEVPIKYRQAVSIFWQYPDQPMTYLSRRCSCDYRTFEQRVIDGHIRLRSELYQMLEMYREQREQYISIYSVKNCCI